MFYTPVLFEFARKIYCYLLSWSLIKKMKIYNYFYHSYSDNSMNYLFDVHLKAELLCLNFLLRQKTIKSLNKCDKHIIDCMVFEDRLLIEERILLLHILYWLNIKTFVAFLIRANNSKCCPM